jgi:uncharacterized protein (DUF983 family)
MPKRKSTCAVCGEPITADRYQDVTAALVVTAIYSAWGHDNLGLGERASQVPTPHWAHPRGGDPCGVIGRKEEVAHVAS